MKFIVASSAVFLLAQQVSAHGYLSQPAAYFPNGIDTSYNGILTESADPAFAGLKWNDNPEANTAMFTKSFPNSKFKTLRALMDTAAPDCGKTSLTGKAVDVSALSSMKWQNDQEQKGFIDSHHGPCEAWIDDTRVFQSDDCRADYAMYPAEIPIDYSSCSGDCTFTFYWLAMHEPNWQVYKQCAPIVNGSGGAQTATTDAPASTKTPTTTDSPTATEAPVASTDASEATDASAAASDSEYTSAPASATDAPASDSEYTPAPESTTATPEETTDAPTTESPAATSKTSCKTRRRRMTANLRSEN